MEEAREQRSLSQGPVPGFCGGKSLTRNGAQRGVTAWGALFFSKGSPKCVFAVSLKVLQRRASAGTWPSTSWPELWARAEDEVSRLPVDSCPEWLQGVQVHGTVLLRGPLSPTLGN